MDNNLKFTIDDLREIKQLIDEKPFVRKIKIHFNQHHENIFRKIFLNEIKQKNFLMRLFKAGKKYKKWFNF